MRGAIVAGALCAVAVLAAGRAQAATINIAVEYSAASPMSLEGAIKVVNALNNSVAFDFNAVAVTGAQIDTAAELAAFDTVVIGDGGDGGNDDLGTFAAALKNWVLGGGGLVASAWIIWESGNSTGTPNADIDAVVPVNTSGPYHFVSGGTVNIVNTSHEVTTGVNDFFVSGCCVEYPSAPEVDPWGVVLGTVSGHAAVVAGGIGSGRSVYLGPTYMGANSYSSNIYSGEADQLLEQAVFWASAANPTPVPEPTSLVLLGTGVAGALWRRRRARAPSMAGA